MDQILISNEDRRRIEDKADGVDLWFSDDEDGNVSWSTDYSGRGMYGDNCVGVVLSGDSAFASLVICVVEAMGADWAYDLFSKVRTDSMGYSTIYYFPGVTAEWARTNADA